MSALIGAALALATGVVQPGDIPDVWRIVWNATATFIAIIITSLILDEAGFFEWSALHVARWGGGRGRLLFVLIVLLGAVVSALFANDGAALILTPIVMEMLLALGFGPGASLAFVMAAGFIADTGSIALIVSNLVNIVSADFFGIGFGEYASVMVPVNLMAVASTLAVLLLFFRKSIPPRYDVSQLPAPPRPCATRSRSAPAGRAGAAAGGLLHPGTVGHPGQRHRGRRRAGPAADRRPPAHRRHATRHARRALAYRGVLAGHVPGGVRPAQRRPDRLPDPGAGTLRGIRRVGAAMGTGLATAFLSSVMNNLPTVLVGALSIGDTSAVGPVKDAMIYANVIGSDLGPKITPIGSLATLLWLHVLARKGLRITWGYYFRVGLVLTLPVLLLTLAALAWRLQ